MLNKDKFRLSRIYRGPLSGKKTLLSAKSFKAGIILITLIFASFVFAQTSNIDISGSSSIVLLDGNIICADEITVQSGSSFTAENYGNVLEGNCATIITPTGDGTITLPVELTDIESLPDKFILKSAYPNPFNPTTTIQYGIPDTLWLLITYDNFENLEIQNVYNRYEFPIIDLSRGTESGELYFVTSSPQTIYYSNDYGLSWQYINEFNPGLDYTDLVGTPTFGGGIPSTLWKLITSNLIGIKETQMTDGLEQWMPQITDVQTMIGKTIGNPNGLTAKVLFKEVVTGDIQSLMFNSPLDERN